MTDQWHEPAFRLKKCEESMTREAGDGYFASANDVEVDEFSPYPCELCGTPLAGVRSRVIRIHPTEDDMYYSVCVDCEHFVEYGQLDDMSMMEIEDDQDRR